MTKDTAIAQHQVAPQAPVRGLSRRRAASWSHHRVPDPNRLYLKAERKDVKHISGNINTVLVQSNSNFAARRIHFTLQLRAALFPSLSSNTRAGDLYRPDENPGGDKGKRQKSDLRHCRTRRQRRFCHQELGPSCSARIWVHNDCVKLLKSCH